MIEDQDGVIAVVRYKQAVVCGVNVQEARSQKLRRGAVDGACRLDITVRTQRLREAQDGIGGGNIEFTSGCCWRRVVVAAAGDAR